MNKKLLTILSFIFFSGAASAQTVTYDILVGDLVGLSLTSGDICSAPFTTEEARQTSIGNSWGATWTSTNGGIATSISVELSFTVADTVAMHNITLNGNPAGSVNSGPSVSCAAGTVLNWTIVHPATIPWRRIPFWWIIPIQASSTSWITCLIPQIRICG